MCWPHVTAYQCWSNDHASAVVHCVYTVNDCQPNHMLRQSVYSSAGSGVGRGVLRHAAITVHTSKAHNDVIVK
jgi:hypothetical protein